jgi:hypothetical protein
LVGSLEVITLENQPSTDVYVKQMHSLLDSEAFSEFAPWNAVFRKTKPIFINRK